MADVFSKKKRSEVMSKIHSSKTKPELKIKKFMKMLGFSYQLKNIFGKPDFADKENKIAVFVDGCFWHGCKKHCRVPKRNNERDKEVSKHLKRNGWKVIRIWGHEVK